MKGFSDVIHSFGTLFPEDEAQTEKADCPEEHLSSVCGSRVHSFLEGV